MSRRNAFSVQKSSSAQPTLPGIALHFNYERLPVAKREAAQEIARSIKAAGNRIHEDYLVICQKLLEAREKELFPENDWQDWVKDEFGFEPRKTQMMMNVARTYREREDAPKLLALMGDTVALMVSQPSIPQTVRAKIEEIVQEEGPITTRDAKRKLRDLTHKEAIHIISQVLDEMSPQEQQRTLNSSTHMLKQKLPDDVTLSDSVLTSALMALRNERLAILMPAPMGTEDLLDASTEPKVLQKQHLPVDLQYTGWELRQLNATGEWFCINTTHSVSTEPFRSWTKAVEAAQEMQTEIEERKAQEEKRVAALDEEIVQVPLRTLTAKKLLAALSIRMPGMTERELQEVRDSIRRTIDRVAQVGVGDVD